jgi:hypothetical protein
MNYYFENVQPKKKVFKKSGKKGKRKKITLKSTLKNLLLSSQKSTRSGSAIRKKWWI